MLTLEAFVVENFVNSLPCTKAAVSKTITNSNANGKNTQQSNNISQPNNASRYNLHDTQPQTKNLTTNNYTITQHDEMVETNFEMDIDRILTPEDSTTPTASNDAKSLALPTTSPNSSTSTTNFNKIINENKRQK